MAALDAHADLVAAGVPADEVLGVAELRDALGDELAAPGALADATTLLRFVRARENKVDDAAKMWRGAHAWRRTHLPRALSELGAFDDPSDAALDAAPTEGRWTWRQHADATKAPTALGRASLAYGHSTRLRGVEASDGAPVLVWRLGALDIEGVAREDLADALLMRQSAHLEDALQAARAASCRLKRLVRSRVVIDLKGVSIMATLRRLDVIKHSMAVGKAYFPEVTASVTIVNAPFGFETLWRAISLFLNDMMRAKIRLVGWSFEAALREHAKIDDIKALPVCLGGAAADPPTPEVVPAGAGKLVAGEPPFQTGPAPEA